MLKNQVHRTLRSAYVLSLAVLWILAIGKGPSAEAGLISAGLQSALQTAVPGEQISVIAYFTDGLDISGSKDKRAPFPRAGMIKSLRETADLAQGQVRAHLGKRGATRMKSLWLVNALAVTAGADAIRELAAQPHIKEVRLDRAIPLSETFTGTAGVPEWNLAAVRASEIWEWGYKGQGVVLASMDTGVDPQHPDLAGRWRGGTNSWFDPNGEHDTPHDVHGHGTRVMGIMVGGDMGGTAIGAAPQAKWIAVKIFNDAGYASMSSIHEGYQWLLDPDGNEYTDDAPDIINNSWGLLENVDECSEEFVPDIQILKAAGIEVIFGAGNTGPEPSTSLSPANYPESIAVGAVDDAFAIAPFSGRGPSTCDNSIYPELAAPGVNIRTTDLTFGGIFPNSYATVTGTSFATPHVTGIMALLMSAFPEMSLAELEHSLKESALDLGDPGPDNDFGFGLVDGVEAYNHLIMDGLEPCNVPVVVFAADPNPAAVGELVTFTSDVSGGFQPYAYAWDMDGDGTTDCFTPECTHTYPEFFNGIVELLVTDSRGCSTLETVAISVGITVSGAIRDPGENPVPNAVISIVEHPEISHVSSEPDGRFILSGVPPNRKVHVMAQGPAQDHVETYSFKFTTPSVNMEQDAVIVRRSDMDPIVQVFSPHADQGIILGLVTNKTGGGVAGALISATDSDGNALISTVGYADSGGIWNPAQKETSSGGIFVIYNIGEVGRDVLVTAKKANWSFTQVEAHVYSYMASPERVTVAPLAGQEIASGGSSSGGSSSGGGGCFVSALTSAETN